MLLLRVTLWLFLCSLGLLGRGQMNFAWVFYLPQRPVLKEAALASNALPQPKESSVEAPSWFNPGFNPSSLTVLPPYLLLLFVYLLLFLYIAPPFTFDMPSIFPGERWALKALGRCYYMAEDLCIEDGMLTVFDPTKPYGYVKKRKLPLCTGFPQPTQTRPEGSWAWVQFKGMIGSIVACICSVRQPPAGGEYYVLPSDKTLEVEDADTHMFMMTNNKNFFHPCDLDDGSSGACAHIDLVLRDTVFNVADLLRDIRSQFGERPSNGRVILLNPHPIFEQSVTDKWNFVLAGITGPDYQQRITRLKDMTKNVRYCFRRAFVGQPFHGYQVGVPRRVVEYVDRALFNLGLDRSSFAANASKKLWPDNGDGRPRMLLVNRGGTNRRLGNHKEILQLAESLGMKAKEFVLQDLPPQEQMFLVASSDVLIGAHGAAFSWLVFMQPGSVGI
eukprot:gene5222-936_t